MNTWQRVGLSVPLIGFTGLVFGITVIGGAGLWQEYTGGERALTVGMCLLAGAGLGLSLAVAADRRIDEVPWLRIALIGVLLVVAFGLALARRSLVLQGV